MSRIYRVLNKKDCAELGVSYSLLSKVVLAEHNVGHYTITRYASTLGKIVVVICCPFFLLWHIGRAVIVGVKDCASAIHDVFQMVDRRDIWGEENKYISYLKENY